MQYGNTRGKLSRGSSKQFKSYYVVWKPAVGLYAVIDPPDGLNRTMQYGNKNPYILGIVAGAVFKSYYVVWKPKNPALIAIGLYGV